jgi:hypothetical protein
MVTNSEIVEIFNCWFFIDHILRISSPVQLQRKLQPQVQIFLNKTYLIFILKFELLANIFLLVLYFQFSSRHLFNKYFYETKIH